MKAFIIKTLASKVINRVSLLITGGSIGSTGVDPATVPVETAIIVIVSAMVSLLSEWADKKMKG